ncbi:MAG: prephenate dehydrogenase [Lachnospiraceae bacterium]|nr:prephenate dehydrogenase [Lachnospiraceae bacterium]
MSESSTQNFPFQKFHFIGLGLIGGSIAKAVRKTQPDAVINVYARHPEKLCHALSDKVVNRVNGSITDIDKDTDVIFLCAPTGANIKNLENIKKYISGINPHVLITDVGSVKGDIQNAVDDMGLSASFLGGHPMTGKEKTGYESADAAILENAYYILTPSKETGAEFTERFSEFVKQIHSIPLCAAPKEHDFATAAISHLPHLIAASLVKTVKDHDSSDEFMKTIAAGGFKDITRIASSDPSMWENICRSNTENIRVLLRDYIRELEKTDAVLASGDFDKINELFKESGAYRASMPEKGRGPIPPIFRIYVDIPDESGAIAGIATLLAKYDISIMNTGITHNREQAEGALYIEFYDENAMNKAIPIVKEAGYKLIF